MPKPPTHRIAQVMRIIEMRGFDTSKVLAEQALVQGEEDDNGDSLALQHPVQQYRSGKTRFDLDALGQVYIEGEDGEIEAVDRTAREYLRDQTAPVFEARRLTMGEIAACADTGDAGGAVLALHMGLKKIEGVEGLEFSVGRRKSATDTQIEAAKNAVGFDAMLRIGRMILDGSSAPTSAEKKPSGSSRGAS